MNLTLTYIYDIITLKLIILVFHNTKIINFNIIVDKIISRYSKHDSPPNFLIINILSLFLSMTCIKILGKKTIIYKIIHKVFT